MTDGQRGQALRMRRRFARVSAPSLSFSGFRFPPDVISVAVRWYVRYSLSYRDVKVAGRWVYLHRAIDQYGQVIDVLVSEKRDLAAARRFVTRVLRHRWQPAEVTTDWAPAYPRVLEELAPTACHITEQYADSPVGSDHGWLKPRLRPMPGLKRLRSARVISAGHAFVQTLRRDHYELGLDADPQQRLPTIFAELARAI